MLSEILEAYAPKKRTARPGRSGISMSSLFPCPYRLRLVHEGTYYGAGDITAQEFWNMEDGADQESQSVRRLAAARVLIENRQRKVFIGKSMVPGMYDGDFTLNGKRYLWEHKAYDSLAQAVQFLQQWGMDKLPAQKAQTNGYMLGGGLEWCDFFVKIKNNNTYIDVAYQIDRPFIEEIAGWCDDIRIKDWKPEPKECEWCSMCGVNCFDTVDMSWMATASEAEMVEKWIKGKQFIGIGKMMQEEADSVFLGVKDKQGNVIQKGLIGDKEVLVLPGLEIRKSVQHRFEVSKDDVLREFGPEGLIKVGQEHTIIQYRHKETG